MTVAHRVIAVDLQYYLAESGATDTLTTAMYHGFNGLISSNGALAIIFTGTEMGPVSVTADWRDEPPALDIAPWDEVVEISMRFVRHPAGVFGAFDDKRDAELIPALPPGSYRVRVHARGRDAAYAVRHVRGSPLEEHLIIAWPAPPGPEVLHKLTDACGVRARAW